MIPARLDSAARRRAAEARLLPGPRVCGSCDLPLESGECPVCGAGGPLSPRTYRRENRR